MLFQQTTEARFVDFDIQLFQILQFGERVVKKVGRDNNDQIEKNPVRSKSPQGRIREGKELIHLREHPVPHLLRLRFEIIKPGR